MYETMQHVKPGKQNNAYYSVALRSHRTALGMKHSFSNAAIRCMLRPSCSILKLYQTFEGQSFNPLTNSGEHIGRQFRKFIVMLCLQAPSHAGFQFYEHEFVYSQGPEDLLEPRA